MWTLLKRRQCYFDPNNDFMLSINVTVPGIEKQSQHDYDVREITLISKERYDDRNQNQAHVDIFNSMNAINDGECIGQKDGYGNVIYRNVVNNTRCEFSVSHEIDSQGVLFYTQTFVVGYDDLVLEMFPDEPPVIKRYGQNWNFNCRIRASDTQYVYPGAEGERDLNEYNADLDIDFNLEMFTEPTFQPEYIFEDGGMIDIGVNSDEKQVIYVQAKANIKSGDSADYMLHIKECKVERTEKINGVEHQLNPLVFLIDGCMAPGNNFVENTFKIKPSRVQWNDDNDEKTVVVDQFTADLWDPEVNIDPSIEEQSYRFKCDLVVCQIDSFQRNSEDLHYNSICRHDQCSRYNNLFTNGRYNRNWRNEKYGRSDVFQAEGGLKVNILKDGEVTTTTTTTTTTKTTTTTTTAEPVTCGAPFYGLALSLITFITLL